jgi:hypothetical protein
MLPHYLPPGQMVYSGGDAYAQDASGSYYRRQVNGWVRLDAVSR